MSDQTPHSADAALAAHIAQYHLSRRDPAAVRTTLAEFVDAPPASPRERRLVAEALAGLAQLHLARREAAEARDAAAAASALADVPAARRAAAGAAAALGDSALAREIWQQVTAAEPDQESSWLGLARACEAAGDTAGAVDAYVMAAGVQPSHATTLLVAERLKALAPMPGNPAPPAGVRIALIGSSTLDHMRAYLEVACRRADLIPSFYVGPFDQYAQEILDPASDLYAFGPEVVILAVHGRALFLDLYDHPFDLEPEERRAKARDIVDQTTDLLRRLAARTPALVLCHTFATPQYSPLGTLDLSDAFGQTALFADINGDLADRVRRDLPSVRLIDEDRVYGRVGKRHVTDPRMWFLARIGVGEQALGALAEEYMRYVMALKGRARKCLVLDLDNTLWGGVVGEDGPHGIALGQDAPGNAFLAFQQAILDLSKRGVILAINSKNNEADALEALERHPDMILRPRHFSALRINWQDKATNLQSIADELNIGLDSMVFLDDNPAERALVRARLPEVLTPDLPRDPAHFRGFLLRLAVFDTLVLTEEDRARGQLYAQRRERRDWEERHADDLGSYLAELGLEVEVVAADAFAIPRIAQLIGKTNQFNLTTRRHSEAQVRAFASSGAHAIYAVRVKDRFGDHGLVGTAILTRAGVAWIVDTFLLSCRVLGRGVETAVLSALVDAVAEARGAVLRGVFIPTAKNAPARDFYERHGFTLVAGDDGEQIWELPLESRGIAPPPWVKLRVAVGAI